MSFADRGGIFFFDSNQASNPSNFILVLSHLGSYFSGKHVLQQQQWYKTIAMLLMTPTIFNNRGAKMRIIKCHLKMDMCSIGVAYSFKTSDYT